MAKYKLSQGQGLGFGPYVVQALTGGVELVAIAVPEPITVLRPALPIRGQRWHLSPRQSLMIGERRLVCDSGRSIELAVSGPETEISIDQSFYPKPTRATSG